MEWMYKNSSETVDREEYLLGRAIDKNIESQLSGSFNEVDKDITPVSIFTNSGSNLQVDVARKLKEDPLEQIRQKELETRKQLLKNPVKMKKLQNMSEDVFALQQQEWDPVISWFCKKYDVDIAPTTDLVGPTIASETKDSLRKHLLSYNMNAIHGFNLAIESLKSIVLTLCCVERRITVDKAVLLSRLEEEFQAGRWGRVEWAHDINQLDLQSRVAAAIIFIQINSMSEETKSKLVTKFK